MKHTILQETLIEVAILQRLGRRLAADCSCLAFPFSWLSNRILLGGKLLHCCAGNS